MLCLESLLCLIRDQKLPLDTPVVKQVHETLNLLENYHENNCFNGSAEQLFSLIEFCSKNRPESSIIRLLSYKAQGLGPTRNHWLGTLKSLLEIYYEKDARSSIRIKALNVLKNSYVENKYLYAEQIIDKAIVPLCSRVEKEKDYEVLEALTNLLVDVAKEQHSGIFNDVVKILERIVNDRLQFCDFGRGHAEDTATFFIFLDRAICGLLEIVAAKWSSQHPMQALQIVDTVQIPKISNSAVILKIKKNKQNSKENFHIAFQSKFSIIQKDYF